MKRESDFVKMFCKKVDSLEREIDYLKRDVAKLKISRVPGVKSTCMVAKLLKKMSQKEVQESISSSKCRNCGKIGHKSEECWSLEKNKEKFEKFKEKF